MTENWIQFVEIGIAILAILASLFAGLRLRHDAKKHEHAAEVLGEKIKRAIN